MWYATEDARRDALTKGKIIMNDPAIAAAYTLKGYMNADSTTQAVENAIMRIKSQHNRINDMEARIEEVIEAWERIEDKECSEEALEWLKAGIDILKMCLDT